MSGLGRTLADLELRSARAMSAAQERWDNMAPPEPTELDDLAAELNIIAEQAQELIGRALRSLDRSDLALCRSLLIEAGKELAENAEAVQEVEL